VLSATEWQPRPLHVGAVDCCRIWPDERSGRKRTGRVMIFTCPFIHLSAHYRACDCNILKMNELFMPRDAMHKCGLCRHVVSVCLSVTFVHSVKTNKDIFKIFSPSGSHTILVFPYQTGWRYSDGNPPNEGIICRWGRQKSRF